MHIQWHLAGGKSKEDKDSNGKDKITLAATNTKNGGKKPNSGGNPKKENPIRMRSATTAVKRDISRTRAGRSTLRRSRSWQRIVIAKQRNIPKETSGKNMAREYNGRVFHNLAKINVPEKLGEIEIAKLYWRCGARQCGSKTLNLLPF
jgi:hypothetical protein